ncbi:MAG: diguanylate cyclase [Azonexus sp.]
MNLTNGTDRPYVSLMSMAPESLHQPIDRIEPLRFLQAISASLDLDQVLSTLNRFLEKLVGHSDWQYRHAEWNIELEGGQRDHHQLEYDLVAGSERIGTFALTRSRRFSESDRTCIESLLGLATPALHNALRYRAVVQLVERDTLTGLGNRRALSRQGVQWLADAIRHDRPLSMLVLDLDDFKFINDTFGHPAGDRLLVSVADILRGNTRTSDLCIRMGGDEFAVMLPGADLEDAIGCAQRIRLAIAACAIATPNGDAISGSVSIGVASYGAGMDLDALYQRADDALYTAKRAGGNQVLAGNEGPCGVAARSTAAAQWRLACNDREINTLGGHPDWIAARQSTMRSEVLGEGLDSIWALIPEAKRTARASTTSSASAKGFGKHEIDRVCQL